MDTFLAAASEREVRGYAGRQIPVGAVEWIDRADRRSFDEVVERR